MHALSEPDPPLCSRPALSDRPDGGVQPAGLRWNNGFARWLLTTRDRVGTSELHMTQQVLAEMLGVRRPSVTSRPAFFRRPGSSTAAAGSSPFAMTRNWKARRASVIEAVREEFDRFLP